MSISAKLRRGDNKKIKGILVPVPLAVHIENAVRNGSALEFTDLGAFQTVVKEFRERGLLSDYPPYLAFIRQPTRAPTFDWSTIPAETAETIMDHQRDAVDEITGRFMGRAMITLGPGKGKTMIGCLALMHYGQPTIIICPASKITDWQKEMEQWTGLASLVVSFDMLRRRPDLVASRYTCVVVDESHKIKGDSQRAKLVMQIMKSSPAGVLLSGTPQENRPSELFNQLQALHPTVFTCRRTFTERFSDGHVGSRGVWEERGALNLEELSILMDQIQYRRDDVSVVDVALRRFKVELVPTDSQQVQLKALDARRVMLREEEGRARTAERKRQIGLERNQHANRMWQVSGRFKLEQGLPWLRCIQEKHRDEKIAVFVYHHEVAMAIKEAFGVDVISGKTSRGQRDLLLGEFRQRSGGPTMAVLTMDAVGDGINLTPGVSVIVCFELHRVPSKMEQVEKRAFRKGQEQDVTTYWLTLKDSSDETILEKLQTKSEINSRVLNGNKKSKFTFEH